MKRHSTKVFARLTRGRAMKLAALVVLLSASVLWYLGCGIAKKETASADNPPTKESADSAQPPEAPAPPPPMSVTIPSGTSIQVRLLQTISSRTAHSGQGFSAELTSPVLIQDQVIFPKSSRVRGRVLSARSSGRLHDPGYLRLTLDAIQEPDGHWVDIRTTSVSAKGRSHKKRNLTIIGGVAGVGAVIGAIAGGGKGAAIGAASGAGAGTAGAYATGKQDVTLAAEHKLRFVTVESVVLNL